MDQQPVKPVRWWLALVIAILGAVTAIALAATAVSAQDRFLRVTMVTIVTSFVLLLWALLLSRFRARTRLSILALVIVMVGGLAATFQISGVTGDLKPILRPRWKAKRTFQTATVAPVATNRTALDVSFPQFLGPTRNGVIPNVTLDTNWTARPPELLWKREVGEAWTGFVVANGLAITQEQRDEKESVCAYDLLTGAPVWSHGDVTHFKNTIGGEGPRANPTIADGRVYTVGARGLLNCLELTTGKLIWTRNFADFDSKLPDWGYAGAPLVVGNKVIVNAGGKPEKSLVAFEAATGKLLWGVGDQDSTFNSPTLLTALGMPQVILFNHRQVQAHDPETGAELWTHPWPGGHPKITMPILISTNQVLASSGYGYGSELIEVSKSGTNWTAARVWKSNRLKSKFADLILHGGFVYGLDDGILTCMDPATGERKWHGDRLGHGQLLLVGNVILMTAESGEVLLVDPSPQEQRIVARLRAFNSKTWNPPALAGQYLLVRNNLEAACYKLPLAK